MMIFLVQTRDLGPCSRPPRRRWRRADGAGHRPHSLLAGSSRTGAFVWGHESVWFSTKKSLLNVELLAHAAAPFLFDCYKHTYAYCREIDKNTRGEKKTNHDLIFFFFFFKKENNYIQILH